MTIRHGSDLLGLRASPPRVRECDLRTLHLEDPSSSGRTFQEDQVFDTLVGHVERDEIRPVVSR